jgi:hypothetical protein
MDATSDAASDAASISSFSSFPSLGGNGEVCRLRVLQRGTRQNGSARGSEYRCLAILGGRDGSVWIVRR